MTNHIHQFNKYHVLDNRILSLWREGKDTREIARAFWMNEYDVANRLPEILLRARQDQDFDRLQA